MDANSLLYYLRGVFENVPKPSKQIWENICVEVLQATPVEREIIPVEVRNGRAVSPKKGDCGCGEIPTPVLQEDKI